jgi:hypothetical protein
VRARARADRRSRFNDPVIPPFHYGSHYSTAGTVLYYLIRMEPFTTLSIELQGTAPPGTDTVACKCRFRCDAWAGGKFDHADRMFDSVASTWHNCLNHTADVKELIPEFFYLPEFLVNSNNFDLGTKQNGQPIGDVILPPWARTPEEFIRINREVLPPVRVYL